jgi:hypothetical protein
VIWTRGKHPVRQRSMSCPPPNLRACCRVYARHSSSPVGMDACRERGFRRLGRATVAAATTAGPNGCLVTTNAPGGGSHSNGTHAFETDVTGNEFDSKFGMNTSPASEYYISGWRYDTPGASQGIDDYFAESMPSSPTPAFRIASSIRRTRRSITSPSPLLQT